MSTVRRSRERAAPLAIEARNLKKSFRIPTHRVDSLKERVIRPFAAREYHELQALNGISFDILQGEFFGIVGRNGSGKSTLLKLLASIYRADGGKIRMAGRLAPFIELGVGFNTELTARENVVLNGVMMGLTPREIRARVGAVIEFAELDEFADLKLKNFSSGMLVRLAFSAMLQADADILLIDEVLAVGDAAFQQKCADAFQTMRGEGRTIVLVTHDMPTVESYCHRAMLIDDGVIQHLGDPADVGRRYLQLNFERGVDGGGSSASNDEVRLARAWIEDETGTQTNSLESGIPIRLRVELEFMRDLAGVGVGFIVANAEGVNVAQFGVDVEKEDGSRELGAGERVLVKVDIENLLRAGRYYVHTGVNRVTGGVALYAHNSVDFVVFGGDPHSRGVVQLPIEASTEVGVGVGG